MSIKQNGGVFGRNPTFNDVTIEGQLTFDGDIDINSDLKVDGELEVTGEILANGGIGLGDNDLVTFGVGDDLTLRHNGSNSYITNTTGILVVQGTNSGTWVLNGSGQPVFKTDANAVILGYGSGEKFRTVNAGISVTGNVAVTSGSGIDFSATAGTGTSELFSDYEEGTWTPTLVGSSGGSATMSLTRRTYTKIGNVVHLFMYLSAIDTTAGGFSGAIQIEGLPFSPASGSEQGVVSTVCNIFTTDEQQIGISGQILSNKIVLKKGASTTNYTNSDLASTSSGSFMLHATYRA
tara:strand:- start:1528 stop:2406 length:879 start_codon:yes stop_codon:yes gene_type:complete